MIHTHKEWKRVTVKVGSNVLTRTDGTLDITRMSALTDQIAALRKRGIDVILVSSGAVAAGRSEVTATRRLDSVDQRQLFSAVGQAKLMNRYYELFREHGMTVGQVLTMKENFATRRLYLNQRNCMTVMLENGVIPIVNENDTVSVSELMFTDNDELSGLIASMMDADLLVILSNVDGLYDGNPDDPQSHVIPRIEPGTDISTYVRSTHSSLGRGGMSSKTGIAAKVAEEGIEVVIANGKRDDILTDLLCEGKEVTCTRFVPSHTPISGVKKWIAHSGGFAKGELHVDQGTTRMLASGQAASILPVGITAVKGEFEKDDIVRIMDADGRPMGVGKAACSCRQAQEAMGKQGEKPVVHYNYLYME